MWIPEEMKRIDTEHSMINSPDMWVQLFLKVSTRTKDSLQNKYTKIKSAWTGLAAIGRYCDEQLGEWPNNNYFKVILNSHSNGFADLAVVIDDWSDELHERDWIWWSSICTKEYIMIELCIDSYPCSFNAITKLACDMGMYTHRKSYSSNISSLRS